MKILIINQHYLDAIGGSEIQCDLIAKGLSNRKHDVIYGVVGNRKKAFYDNGHYKIIPLFIEDKNKFKIQISEIAPDLIYWRYNKIFLRRASSIFKKLGIPYIFAISSNTDALRFSYKERKKGKNLFRNFLNHISYLKQMLVSNYNFKGVLNATAITSLNSHYLQNFDNKKSFVVWNSVDQELVPFNWPRPYVVWISNIKANKRPEKFIFLAESLNKVFPDIDFIMVGELRQESYDSLINLKSKTVQNFYYLGGKSLQEVNGILKNSLFMVHTCMPEGFGNNFIQAWLQGKPTVSFEFDPDGLITENKMGFISKGSETEFVEHCKLLISDERLRNQLGENAYEFSSINFSRDQMIDKLEKILEEIISS